MANLCQAQDWFEIEVIVFEHKTSEDSLEDAERWPRDLDLAWPSPLIELEAAVERTESIEILPPFEEMVFDQRRLNNASYALRVREPYELLWHKAWKAPLLPEEQAPWILVQAGEELGSHYRLEGAIRIHLSRYLHLSTDLWLTEVSGSAFIAEDSLGEGIAENLDKVSGTQRAPETSLENNLNQGTESEFDWSQLPKLSPVRWGCNYVRERWPEDNRLLPADYYDDPAPADWYYPFGCRTPFEQIDMDVPYFVNVPTSAQHPQTELELYYPELFNKAQPEETIESNSILKQGELGPNGLAEEKPFSIDKQAFLNEVEVVFADENGVYPDLDIELIAPEPEVSYPVKEIIHIKDRRRMRSGEFHYVDHPKIGVLAIIHPVEKPELILDEEMEQGVEISPGSAP